MPTAISSRVSPSKMTRARQYPATAVCSRQATERFFLSVYQWQLSQPRGNGPNAAGGSGRVREPKVVPDTLSGDLTKLGDTLHELAKGRDSEEERMELTSRGDRLYSQAKSVKEWLNHDLDGQVYWVEVKPGRVPRVSLASAPIEVGPALKAQLYDKVPSVILTSALSTAGTCTTVSGPAGAAHGAAFSRRALRCA